MIVKRRCLAACHIGSSCVGGVECGYAKSWPVLRDVGEQPLAAQLASSRWRVPCTGSVLAYLTGRRAAATDVGLFLHSAVCLTPSFR